MKNRRLLIIPLAIALIAVLAIGAFAASGDSGMKAFTVTDSEGAVVKEGDTEAELRAAFAALADGETLTLNKDIEITSGLIARATEAAPKTVNFDLAGNMLYCFEKIGMAMVSAGQYTTVNVYSSEPGGAIYVTKKAENTKGANIFSIVNKSAVMNVGEITVGDVTYPGSNLSTYGACLVDLMNGEPCDANSRLTIIGGTYYSIQSDYSGFIIPRVGEATITVRDADIILHETRPPINSEGADTVLNLENVKMLQYDGASISLFNSLIGTVNMKNCVTTYAVKANSVGTGKLNLIGRNVFSSVAGFDTALINGITDPVAVTTAGDYELIGGGLSYKYFDRTGSLETVNGKAPLLNNPIRVEARDKTQNYIFISGDQTVTQSWSVYEEPIKPFSLPADKKPGVYKYDWRKSVDENGTITYTAGKVADYPIKVNLGYDFGLYFNIYIPADLIEEGYLEHSDVRIDGGAYPRTDWKEVEIGEAVYYCATTGTVDETDINRTIEVYLPCDYGNGISVQTSWQITLGEYFERVLDTEADKTYTEEQYDLVHELKDTYLPANDSEVAGGGASAHLSSYDTTGHDLKYVKMTVKGYGSLVLLLDATAAPATVDNFLALVNAGFYDGLTFHRVIENFMIQGGCPNGDGTGKAETTVTGEFALNGYEGNIDLTHLRGVISMARAADYDSASCQFFICNADYPSLDQQYAAFGFVIAGMDVVDGVTAMTSLYGNSNGVIEDKAEQAVITSVTVITENEALSYVID